MSELAGLRRVTELNNTLTTLLRDPQPGLVTRQELLSDVLEELAAYCGTEVAEYACKVREGRTPQ